MKNYILRFVIAVGLLALTSLVQAQSFSGHYPAGAEGIKGATLPPPGFYFRDYNYFFVADRFPGGPPDFDLFVYVQLLRPIWISKFKLLGGYYGADVLVPFAYQNLKIGDFKDDQFGLGDICVEPITLSWHLNRFDLSAGYAFWAPTGQYDPSPGVHSGKGFWAHMLTAGATWYPDKDKTWALSALNRYEFNHENTDWDITPGQVWTLEWALSKTFRKTIDVGLVGYYQLQTTSDCGTGASNAKDQVIGLGPEVNLFCPKLGLFTSLRYLREFGAHDRPEGNTINLTFTKLF
jgi:hypothetical protein